MVKLVQRAVDTAGVVIGRGTLPASSVYATRPRPTAIVLVRSLITAALPWTWTGGDRYPEEDLQAVMVNLLRSSLLHSRGTPQRLGQVCFDSSYTTS